MSPRTPILYTDVKRMFDYVNDELIWKENRRSNLIGKPAGSRSCKKRYQVVRVNGKHCKIHRIVFLWHHGYLPETLDHINGDTHDNRISNLREVTVHQNARRKQANKKGASKYKGVHRAGSKWAASIYVDGSALKLGVFNTEIEAAKSYDKAATQYYKEFARLNFEVTND